MREETSRTALLLGEEAVEKLQSSHVAVFGVGGVGAACCEALARAGVGSMTLVDPDAVSLSNINRQFVALHSTVGKLKVEVMGERIRDINPEAKVTLLPVFYTPENAEAYPLADYDYVVDCIDTVSSKLCLIERAHRENVPMISALGAGNKLDPTRFEVADIAKTTVCPLARVLRRELRARGILHHPVVYSTEPPVVLQETLTEHSRHLPGSISFVPPVMGMILAGEAIKALVSFAPTGGQ